jgi:hypothetical protein
VKWMKSSEERTARTPRKSGQFAQLAGKRWGRETQNIGLSIRWLRVRVPSSSLNRNPARTSTCGVLRFSIHLSNVALAYNLGKIWGNRKGDVAVVLRKTFGDGASRAKGFCRKEAERN